MFRFESRATCSCFCSCLDFCSSFRVFLRAVFHQKVGNIPRQSTDIHQRFQSPAGQSQWCFSSISNSSIVIPCYVLGAWGMIRREWKLDLELLCHHAKPSLNPNHSSHPLSVDFSTRQVPATPRSVDYPSYYVQPFHGYDEGNLSWRAAHELEAATQSMCLGSLAEFYHKNVDLTWFNMTQPTKSGGFTDLRQPRNQDWC